MTKKTPRRLPGARKVRQTPKPTKVRISCNVTNRFLDQGPQALSDGELLSIFLRTGPRTTPLDESMRLLAERGSLRSVLSINSREAASAGVSRYNHMILQAALELAQRHLRERMIAMPAMVSSDAVHEFVRSKLRDRRHEVFCCLFLDTQLRVREFKELFRGGVTAANVYVSEVVKIALASNATGVIAVHNHPSGSPEPTIHDRFITLKLKAALQLVDIKLMDHLVIGDDACESFAERGFL